MSWRRRLAAFCIVSALFGCAQGQVQFAPYSPENNGNMHDGGGEGSGGEGAGAGM